MLFLRCRWLLPALLGSLAAWGPSAGAQDRVDRVVWLEGGRNTSVLVEDTAPDVTLEEQGNWTVALWVRLDATADTYPALASNKPWEDGAIVDLLSTSNMGVTLDTGTGPGWTLAVQPSGSWLWNLGNGSARLDYMPTAERQPICDGRWHLLAFTIDRNSDAARLYYDGQNVAIYALNGFGDLRAGQDTFVGGDRAEVRPGIEGLACELEEFQRHATALSDDDLFALYKARFPDAARDEPKGRVDELRVLAWNIWHGARHPGVDEGIQQAVDFIEATQADVITMQETYGSGPILADRLGYYFYLRSSNLSVMSRFPIADVHDLYQPFRFGGVTLRLNEEQRVNVFSLWIHYLPDWRRDVAAEGATAEALIEGEWETRAGELRDILEELEPFIAASNETPLIVGGDFNSPSALDWSQATSDWHDGLAVDWPVSRQMLDRGFTDTYRAIHPDPTEHVAHELWDADAQRLTYRIDYIYVHGQDIAPTASRMMNSHDGTWPSDHPAVLSTLRLRPRQLGIISYNILEGFTNRAQGPFPDGAARRQAVSDWLAEQAPAIVGLQELNGYTEARLQEESRAWGHGHAATVKEGGYVVGLTSREPIEVVERHLDGMHHGLLHCRTMGIECFVVHLSPFRFEHRRREAAIILDRVGAAIEAGRQVLVMGDFNALSPQDRAAYEDDDGLLERLRESDAQHGHVENLDDGELEYSVMQAFLDAGLVDLFAAQRDGVHAPGRRRIDFILASPDLAEQRVDAGWHVGGPFDEMSDHPPTSASLALPTSRQAEPRRVRVLSYNIHHAQGTDGEFDYERLAGIIADTQPDLVALQEVDRATDRSRGVDQAARLGELLGMHSYFAEAMPYDGGGYGTALLSRTPLEATASTPLPLSPDHEPRVAASATARPWGEDGPALTFASTHLSHESSASRLAQTRELNQLFADADQPTLLAGDFNFRPGSEPYREASRAWLDTAAAFGEAQPTSPADNPRARIDYVFARDRARWEVVDTKVIDAPVASDHRPLLVVLELVGD